MSQSALPTSVVSSPASSSDADRTVDRDSCNHEKPVTADVDDAIQEQRFRKEELLALQHRLESRIVAETDKISDLQVAGPAYVFSFFLIKCSL